MAHSQASSANATNIVDDHGVIAGSATSTTLTPITAPIPRPTMRRDYANGPIRPNICRGGGSKRQSPARSGPHRPATAMTRPDPGWAVTVQKMSKPRILDDESSMEHKLRKTIGIGTLHRRQ